MRRSSYDLQYADRVYALDPVLSGRVIDFSKYQSHQRKSPSGESANERFQKTLCLKQIQHNLQICFRGRYDDGIPERKPCHESVKQKTKTKRR